MCLFFQFQLSNTEFKNDKMKHKNTVDTTSQMLHPEVFGLCLRIEAYPITKSILKRNFMHDTFILIDNNLQRRVRMHNIDRLIHHTAFSNLLFYMPNVISEAILGFFMWYQLLKFD